MPRRVVMLLEVLDVEYSVWCPKCLLPSAGIIHMIRTMGSQALYSRHRHCPECNSHAVVT